jgi:hypothetical protein
MCNTDRLNITGIRVESGRSARVEVRSVRGIKTALRYSVKTAALRLILKAAIAK